MPTPSSGGQGIATPSSMSSVQPANVSSDAEDNIRRIITAMAPSVNNNPNALATIHTTIMHESGGKYNNGEWDVNGISGGFFQNHDGGGASNWTGLKNYAASKGEPTTNISPETEAEYFMKSYPDTIKGLANAQSPEEAANIINYEQRFKGYNKPGGEAQRRINDTINRLAYYQNSNNLQNSGNQLASLDPKAALMSALQNNPMLPSAGQQGSQVQQALGTPAYTFKAPVQANNAAAPVSQPQTQVQPRQTPVYNASSVPINGVPLSQMANFKDYLLDLQTAASSHDLNRANAAIDNLIKVDEPSYGLDLSKGQAAISLSEAKATNEKAEAIKALTGKSSDIYFPPQTGKGTDGKQYAILVRKDGGGSVNIPLGNIEKVGKANEPLPKASLGRVETVDAHGDHHVYQQWNDGSPPTEMKFGEGETPYTAGEKASDIKLAGANADLFKKDYLDGKEADLAAQSLNELEGLLGDKGGFWNGVKGKLAQYGIQTGPETSNYQAAQALINVLVPHQRVAGMGRISNLEWQSFLRSLPNLLNTAEGNRLIIDNLRKAVQYRQGRADIASHVLSNEYSPADAFREIRTLESNLGLNNLRGSGSLSQPHGAQPQTQTGGTGSTILAPPIGFVSKGHRFKGGDPSRKESWERIQ
ncbi:hypothetical protein [Liberibacter crescens]|uniref:hypothetical protein n=1 Tax=Liberibacter crescens TaxID=1273132 RepID=UPI0012EE2193|nr:hypothetical protein [Liberibacter crescens]